MEPMNSTMEKPPGAESPAAGLSAKEQTGNKLGLIDPRRGRRRRVKASSWPKFYSTLGLMVSSGVSIVDALGEVAKKNEDVGLTRHLRGTIADVNRGVTLPQAFKNNLPNFPVFHYELLNMAMSVGKLDEVLNYLAEYEESNQRTRLQLRAALSYPLLQAGMAFMLLSIAPAHFEEGFVQTLAALDKDLPTPVFLFCKYSWFANYAAAVLLALGFILILPPVWDRFQSWLAKESTVLRMRRWGVGFFRYGSKVPGLGKALRAYSQERFSRALAIQLEAGRPLVASLKAAFKITGDPFFMEAEESVVGAIANGESVTAALEATELFDEVTFLSFLKAGEESATVAGLLNKSADFQAKNFSTALQQAMTLLNPILLLSVGVLVAVMVFSVFMPLIQLTQSL
jgi:type IV pilus assembly protein PilC